VVALHGKADFFGEGCLTGQPLRLATVIAITECVIVRLDKARNARVEEDLVDQLFNSSEKRLARTHLPPRFRLPVQQTQQLPPFSLCLSIVGLLTGGATRHRTLRPGN
jgi:CRP-like cAMP-binding protein